MEEMAATEQRLVIPVSAAVAPAARVRVVHMLVVPVVAVAVHLVAEAAEGILLEDVAVLVAQVQFVLFGLEIHGNSHQPV